MKNFIHSVIYDFILFIILFIAIFILIKKSKKNNDYLQNEVDKKTKELRNSLVIDNLMNHPTRLPLLEDIERLKKIYIH